MADYEELADRLDQEAEAMRRRSKQLGEEVGQARDDWERKRADPNVPGAPSPEESSSEERPPDAAEGEAPASSGPTTPAPDADPANEGE